MFAPVASDDLVTGALGIAAQCRQQLVSGVYELEQNKSRWMAGQAVILLKSPAEARPLRVILYTPNPRRVEVALDGRQVAGQTIDKPGIYTLEAPAQRSAGAVATVTITVDKTVTVPGDRRELGVVLMGVGFGR